MAEMVKIDTFLQNSSNPVWLATKESRCVYANPVLERLTGLKSEEIIQVDWRSFLLDEDRVAATASWQRSLATGIPYRVRVRMRGIDGVTTTVELTAFGHKGDDGTELWLFLGSQVLAATHQDATLEAQLQATLNVIPANTWYTLPSGALTFVNERTADYLGLPRDHPLRFGIDTGAAWDSHIPLLHPDDHAETRSVWSTCLRTGCAGAVSFRVRSAEGEYRWFLSRAEPLRASDGTLLCWVGVNLDINDAKLAEQALQRSEAHLAESKAKLEEAQRITHVGYWEWDLVTDRVTWSDEIYRIFGMQPQECLIDLATSRKKIHPDDWQMVVRAVEEALAGGARFDVEARILRPTGEVRIVHTMADVKRNASGRPYLLFGTNQDITDRKRAEEALKRSEFHLSQGERLSQMGSWAFNPSGFFDYWSQELFQIYGLDPQRGTPTLERYLATLHPQDRESMAETIKKMIAERGGCDVKKRIVRPDGEQRYIRCVGIPVVEGEVLKGFLGTAMDVTEQELLTQELERRQAHLTEAQKLTHTGSWAWRLADRNTVHLSEEWYRIFGFDPDEEAPTWEKRLERVHPEDRLKWKGTIERAIVEKADYDLEFRILFPNGKVKWIHSVAHPVLSEAGDLEQFNGTSTDITERKSAEQEHEKLRQLETEIAHINRVSMLGEMAASLAHEIKQPIAATITSANTCIEWLAHEPPNLDRARAAAARIDKYGNRAAEIIDRIRSLYRKSPPQRELVDVNEIIDELLTLLKGEATRSSIVTRTDFSVDLPKIMADRVQLQQVFMNLMLNSIEAMEESSGELTVKSQLLNGQLQFSVSDTGPGLPDGNVDQIFSAFFTTKPQGSGMGLAISRSIVESHGGQLWATTNAGRGTTFHFSLPIQGTESSPLGA